MDGDVTMLFGPMRIARTKRLKIALQILAKQAMTEGINGNNVKTKFGEQGEIFMTLIDAVATH